jgi:tRNA/rRNA methyltransferase
MACSIGAMPLPAEPAPAPAPAMKRTKAARGGIDQLPPAPVVILVRPQLAENVGTAARAMLNFGLSDLRLVAPDFGWPSAKAVAAASGAAEILNRMTILSTTAEAIADLHHVYATTARGRELQKEIVDPAAMAAAAGQQLAAGLRVGLMFGPERTGLDNEDLIQADRLVRIAVNPLFPSLNLAQAVLLCGYEWHRRTAPPPPSGLGDPPATKGEVADLLAHLLTELDAVGFFRAADRRVSLSRTIKAMVERMALSGPEVQLMRGIVKELRRGPLQPDKTAKQASESTVR